MQLPAINMQLPEIFKESEVPLLSTNKEKAIEEEHDKWNEKVKARMYVWIAVIIFFILLLVGILLIAFSKMNEKNENDTAGIALAVVGGLGLFFPILYAWKHSEDM